MAGNERQLFAIRYLTSNQIQIYNQNEIRGPSDIYLELFVDVLEYQVLKHRFIYKLNLFYSAYDF